MAKQLGLILWWTLLPGVASFAGEDGAVDNGEGRRLLATCAQTIKQVHVVRYEADYKGTGWVAKRVAAVTGKVVLGGRSSWDIDEFWCEVTLKPHDSEDVINLMAGSDGDQFYLIDPKTKMVYVDMDPAVLGSQGRNVRRVILRELTAKEPLKEMLEAKNIELQGTELVGKDPCHKIEVTTEDDGRSVWFISQKDHLPRRLIRYYSRPDDGEGTTDLTLRRVEIDPHMDGNLFTLAVPAGFTKTDDFAP